MAGLEIAGAPFFLGEPANNGWESPAKLGITCARVEVFCDDPDTVIARALEVGAQGSLDDIKDHQAPWGIHRQGGFVDPFGTSGSSATGRRWVASHTTAFVTMIEPFECWPRRALKSDAGSTSMTNALKQRAYALAHEIMEDTVIDYFTL